MNDYIERQIAVARSAAVQQGAAWLKQYREKLLKRLTDLLGQDGVKALALYFPPGEPYATFKVKQRILPVKRTLKVELEYSIAGDRVTVGRPGDWIGQAVDSAQAFWLTVDRLR